MTQSRDSDMGYLLSDEDVIDDDVSQNEVPLADAALGTTFNDAIATFYCRSVTNTISCWFLISIQNAVSRFGFSSHQRTQQWIKTLESIAQFIQ